MTKPSITKRSVKGAALTYSELDANFQNLADATTSLTAGTGGTAVVADLNGNITLVAGSNVTITGDNTAKTLTISASAGGGSSEVTLTAKNTGTDPQYIPFANAATGDQSLYTDSVLYYYPTNNALVVGKAVTTEIGRSTTSGSGERITFDTGTISTVADDIVVGNGSSINPISIRPASGKTLNLGKPLVDDCWIQLESSAGHIDILCDSTLGMTIGTGPVSLTGYGGNAYITTDDSSTKLYLKTNGTSGSAEIVLNAGANGDLVLVANGTGKVYSNSEFVANTTLTANTKITVPSTSSVSSNSATDKYLSVGSHGQMFDDGNLHLHTSSGSLWLNSLDGGDIQLGMQSNSGTSNVKANGTFYMNSGYGSVAPVYGVRAWISCGYNGTTMQTYASGNLSVSRSSTGVYVFTFATAMPDGNYAISATARTPGSNSDCAVNIHYNTATSAYTFTLATARYGNGFEDVPQLTVSVIR